MRRLLAGFCLLLLVVPAAWAEAPGKGRLWRLERAGVEASWLFGTMHSSDPAVLALPGAVRRAFAQSRTVVGELVMGDMDFGALMTSALLPKGQTLGDLLDPNLHATTLKAAARHGLPASVVDRMQVWVVGLILTEPADEVARRRAGAKVLDDWLQSEAGRQGKAVVGLETWDEQLSIFRRASLPNQIALLRSAVQFPELVSAAQEGFLALYLDGDLPSMWRLFRASLLGSASAYQEIWMHDLVLRRNHRMAERLQPILARGGAFVGVGALHLAGDEGLLVLLRDYGWTVTLAD